MHRHGISHQRLHTGVDICIFLAVFFLQGKLFATVADHGNLQIGEALAQLADRGTYMGKQVAEGIFITFDNLNDHALRCLFGGEQLIHSGISESWQRKGGR